MVNQKLNCYIIGPTKRKKIRTVDFTTTLAEILKAAKKQQEQNRLTYGEMYCQNYYTIGKDKNRTYYDVYCLPVTEKVSEEFNELDLVCVRHNGAFISQKSISDMCLTFRKKIEGIGDFHFHKLRHTYSSKLIASGAPPKDVQELLGHGGHENTQLTKLLDLRRLNKFGRGAICKEFWNRYLTGKFVRMNGHEFRPKNMNQREKQLYRHTMPLKKS